MEQARQGAKRGKIDIGSSRHTPARARGPIEHPRRNLQPSIRCLAGKAAAENRCVTLVDHFMNVDMAARPRMPWIEKLPLLSPVGVLSSSCTL
jgi:hypothetical protein